MPPWNSYDYPSPHNSRQDSMYPDDIFSDLYVAPNMARTISVGASSFDYQPRPVRQHRSYDQGYQDALYQPDFQGSQYDYQSYRPVHHRQRGLGTGLDFDAMIVDAFVQSGQVGRRPYQPVAQYGRQADPESYLYQPRPTRMGDGSDSYYIQEQMARQARIMELQQSQRNVRPYIVNPNDYDPGFDPRPGFDDRNYPQQLVYRRQPGVVSYDRGIDRGWDYDYDPSQSVERQPAISEYREEERPTRARPSQAMGDYDWQAYNKLAETAKRLEGQSITDYDSRVTKRLGCCRAVSLLIHDAWGIDTTDINVRQMERHLRGSEGFVSVDIKDMKPGDLVLGYREENDYPHAAVYLGNGKMFNNDSNLGTMAIQSMTKFNSPEFKRFVILRRPETVPAIPVA